MMTPNWLDRVSGSLLLAACGDAWGAPFEGQSYVDPAAVDQVGADQVGRLRWTDDTAMTLVLAAHLVRHGGTVVEDELATAFAAEWAREPDRGYGPGAARVLAAIGAGESWRHAAGELFDGAGSLGNGAAMRVAPVGLVAGLELSAVAARARRTAMVTHAHPLGRDGAAVQAVAVALAARSMPATPVDAALFLAQVAGHSQSVEFRAALTRAAALLRREITPEQVATELGNDVRALNSVPAALVAFLSAPDDARQAIRFAICVGGDTDTIAAMTGALCGARGGLAQLPGEWRSRLEEASRISELAYALARLPDVTDRRGAGSRVP